MRGKLFKTAKWSSAVAVIAGAALMILAWSMGRTFGVLVLVASPIFMAIVMLAVLVSFFTRRPLHDPPRTNACPSCGYSLAGLSPGSPCPECGKKE